MNNAGAVVRNKSNASVEDIEKKHGYLENNTKSMAFNHLSDHNYFAAAEQNPKPVKMARERMKITALRVIYNCKCCGFRSLNRELSANHNCDKINKEATCLPCTKCDFNIPEGYHRCTKCSYFAKNKHAINIHMRIHMEGTPYKCTECNYAGRNIKELISHYDKVKDLECECGYSTHVKQQMASHKRSHSGEKPYICGICSYAGTDLAGMYRHLKKHTS